MSDDMNLPEGIAEKFRAESVGSINVTAAGGTTGEWVDTYEQALTDGAEFVASGAWTQFEINKIYVKAE